MAVVRYKRCFGAEGAVSYVKLDLRRQHSEMRACDWASIGRTKQVLAGTIECLISREKLPAFIAAFGGKD